MFRLSKLSKIQDFGSSFRREVLAGLTTFATMGYVLAVNPMLLAPSGMDAEALVTATAVTAIMGCLLMGLFANLPIALACGMGSNAFFSYGICLGMGVPWQAALALVLISGCLFLVLSLTGLRTLITEAFPLSVKVGIQCGLGAFIAFIGLQTSGIIVANEATLVTLAPIEPATLLAIGGIFLSIALSVRRVTGALLISIFVITFLGLFIPSGENTITRISGLPFGSPASLAPLFLQLDFNYVFSNFFLLLPALLYLFTGDLFSTTATLIGTTRRAGLLDKEGQIPNADQAFAADATGTILGACCGNSSVTSYVESAAGVEAGGRTGWVPLTVAACFGLSLLATPLILAIPPQATASALVVVGLLLLQGVKQLDMNDLYESAPVALCLIFSFATFNLVIGMAAAFFTFLITRIVTQSRRNEIKPLTWLICAMFVMYFVLSP